MFICNISPEPSPQDQGREAVDTQTGSPKDAADTTHGVQVLVCMCSVQPTLHSVDRLAHRNERQGKKWMELGCHDDMFLRRGLLF